MKQKQSYAELAYAIALAAILAASAYLASYIILGRYYALIALMAFLCAVFSIRIAKQSSRSLLNISSLKGLSGIIESALAKEHSSGCTMSEAISESMSATREGSELSALFNNILRRLSYQEFGSAVLSQIRTCECAGSEAVSMLAKAGEYYNEGLDEVKALSSCRDMTAFLISSRAESAASGINKYTTLQNVLSTVVPSFVLFGFVGYSIMVGTDSMLAAVFAVMVLIIPLLYLAVVSKLRVISSYAA
ncbi:hypothetical protein M1373_00145 [Candidatus Marsarchaeota archaeon]|nr:hypothetical protein [Candidatus Marsarchaeota archaeon]MCL5404411.1 hypothetical protein [Candidatus Marsarchaeota archaeon]